MHPRGVPGMRAAAWALRDAMRSAETLAALRCGAAADALRLRPRARALQEKGGGHGHAGFKAKALLLTLLEVDQSGRGADEVGTITLNLAEFANAGPVGQHERTLPISLKPGVSTGAPRPYVRRARGRVRFSR